MAASLSVMALSRLPFHDSLIRVGMTAVTSRTSTSIVGAMGSNPTATGLPEDLRPRPDRMMQKSGRPCSILPSDAPGSTTGAVHRDDSFD